MQIVRLLVFVVGAAFFDAIVTVALKEAGIRLGALPTMLKVAICWGIVYALVYHVFRRKKGKVAQSSSPAEAPSDPKSRYPAERIAVTARGFHTHGKEFFAAAEAVQDSGKNLPLPLAFLWARSIELLLKSYLLSTGIAIERLRSRQFGHNLVALHREASAKGIDTLIGSEQTIAGLMQVLNFDYGSKCVFRAT